MTSKWQKKVSQSKLRNPPKKDLLVWLVLLKERTISSRYCYCYSDFYLWGNLENIFIYSDHIKTIPKPWSLENQVTVIYNKVFVRKNEDDRSCCLYLCKTGTNCQFKKCQNKPNNKLRITLEIGTNCNYIIYYIIYSKIMYLILW